MKLLRLLFTSVFFLFFLNSSIARHLTGGNMTYECLGNGNYKFAMTLFRDAGCFGCADFDLNVPIGIYQCTLNNNCSDLSQADNLYNFRAFLTHRETLTGSYSCLDSVCAAPRLTEKGVYEFITDDFDFTLPNSNQSYFIVYQRCCFPADISNVVNPDNNGFSVFCEITPRAQIECNTSPKIHFPNNFLACATEKTVIKMNSENSENDSLAYRFCPPFLGGSYILTPPADCNSAFPEPPCPPPFDTLLFSGTFTAENPFDSETGFNINSISETIEFTPRLIGDYLMGLCVDEFRDGNFLSSQQISIPVIVVPECLPTSVFDKNLSNKISLHPNPATAQIYIDLPQNFSPNLFQIKNITGSLLKTGNVNSSISISDLPEGVYFLELIDEKSISAIKRFVIER